MRAAVRAARKQQPARIIVAVPVGAHKAIRLLEAEADEVVCLRTPEPFVAVGMWYAQFGQTTDDEVRALLGRTLTANASPAEPGTVRQSRGILSVK